MKNLNKTPKLLSPAGSYDALCAAISGGADEVYFGAAVHNARIGAKNFSEEEFENAIKLCRVMNVKSNITVNTLALDLEINDILELIYGAACLGADAFIVQDMGTASIIKAEMPSVCLHASTQCACHNKDGALKLFDAGFSRIVLARELSFDDILSITKDAPYETEIFAHGALCVSHSGQCLFSSVVGGRSGNRGMCAQPCRMEYDLLCDNGNCNGCYPLSLKDLSLASHITELSQSGIASIKLEGRMKSPEYVYGVTKIYKSLLEQNRNATPDEISALSELFSRGGFTDGYFTKQYLKSNSNMYGIRSAEQKNTTRIIEKQTEIPKPKRSISAICYFETEKVPSLSLLYNGTCVTVTGQIPISQAKNQPASFDSIAKNLIKTGDTFFSLCADDISMTLSSDAFVPASGINDMRRRALDKLFSDITEEKPIRRNRLGFRTVRQTEKEKPVSVRLYFGSAQDFETKIRSYRNIESVVFPLGEFSKNADILKKIASEYVVGILFPRVLFEGEKQKAKEALSVAKDIGAVFCEVSNIGHIDIVKDCGLKVYGGIGLNITNSLSAQFYSDFCGIKSLVLSPELKFGAVRDIAKKDDVKYCLYAKSRLPLMVLESCIINGRGKKLCNGKCSDCASLCDRTGAVFPVLSQKRLDYSLACRNIIYNSVITDLTAKEELYRVGLDVICISAEPDGYPM